MFLSVHYLIDRGVCCLNRNKDGSMKTVNFGGYNRARQSPYNQKRAVRERFREDSLVSEHKTLRTRELPTLLYNELIDQIKDEEKLKKAITTAVKIFSSKDDKKKDDKEEKERENSKFKSVLPHSNVLMYFDIREFKRLCDIIVTSIDILAKGKVKVEDIADAFSLANLSPEIVLNGRFAANLPSMTSDATVEIAHAISVNAMEKPMDVMVAMDDVTGWGGHLVQEDWSANIMYHYSTVNTHAICDRLKDKDFAQQIIKLYVDSFVYATPKAKSTASAPHTKPFLVRLTLQDHAVSLVDAFSDPVQAPYAQNAVDALFKRSCNGSKMHTKEVSAKFDSFCMYDDFENKIEHNSERVDSVEELIDNAIERI